MRTWPRASRTQPGWTTVANTAMASAPPASRAVTAAVGLQPAVIRALANGPEQPKANAEPIANSRPALKWRAWSPRVETITAIGRTSTVLELL